VKGVIKPHKTKHHPCIIDGVDNKAKRMRVIGRLLNDIHSYSGSQIIAMGLFLMAFTFQRPSEVRTMKWADIDFEEKLWRFRSSKMSVDHIVPLSEQVLALLNRMKSLEFNSDYVLTNAYDEKRCPQLCSFSDALKGMGYKNRMVSHGFRAMARTVLEEDLGFFASIIEMQLSHMVRDPLGRAYNRTTYIKERFTMMNKWASYLNRCYRLVSKEENLTEP
jgi:integrase